MADKGKGGGKNHHKKPSENKLPTHNNFEILEEEGEENAKSNEEGNSPIERKREDNMDITQVEKEMKEDPLNTIGCEGD